VFCPCYEFVVIDEIDDEFVVIDEIDDFVISGFMLV